MFKKNRLGDLLVSSGLISGDQLRDALAMQKQTQKKLGRVFLEANLVNRWQLSYVLARQVALRGVATLVLGLMAMGGFADKEAAAGTIKDVPAKISIAFNTNASSMASMHSYPAVFGSTEKRSSNLKPFTKWTGMFKKFDRDLNSASSKSLVAEWQKALAPYQDLPLKVMAKKVNNYMNKKRYIVDSRNWGKSDYWATPVEFMKRGGDCEDFAIAKYTALRMLGVPEERLRIMIVHDNLKNIPHAILVVYTEQGAYALDNQIKSLVSADGAGRYRPIFSINRTAWWLHTAPSKTILASR